MTRRSLGFFILSVSVLSTSACYGQTTKSKTKAGKKETAAAKSNGDWPTWRGADRNGISSEKGLLKEWPEGGPNLLWKAEGLGEGYSTPSVVGNLLYVMGNRDNKEYLLALDKTKEGAEVWATELGPVRHGGGGYPGPRSTPTVDGKYVYALGLNGDLICVESASGKGVWRHNLEKEFGGNVPGWGYSESVLIDGPWVLCTPGGDKNAILALTKDTGKSVWGSPLGTGPAYSSIVPAQIGGTKQYVQFMQAGVVGVNAKDGAPLWKYTNPANGTANCSTPIVAGNSVFAASGYGTGGGLVEVKKSGAAFDAKETYFTKKMQNHHGGLILVDGHVYGADDPGILTCLEQKTGDVKWTDRTPGKCSLVYADGMLYCRSESGPLTLVEAKSDGYSQKGRFEQPDRSGNPAWPHPVISDGRLYLRDQNVLLCYDVKGK